MVELSRRLMTIASFVEPGSRIADIGTDHGFLPIYLVQRGVISHAVAMDIRKGPLDRAREHVEETGLAGEIETRLSDGLENLEPGEADTVIIAGMGGPLILEILDRGMKVVPTIKRFILSPQSDWSGFRKGLRKLGFVQCREEMVYEDGKYYLVTEVQYRPKGGSAGSDDTEQVDGIGQAMFAGGSVEAVAMDPAIEGVAMQELKDKFGPFLLAEKNPVLKGYLEWQTGILNGILHKLSESKTADAGKRKAEVEAELGAVKAALKMF